MSIEAKLLEFQSKVEYNPYTGEFIKKSSGKKVGTTHNRTGYVYVRIGEMPTLAHRVAWWFAYGSYPEHCIDHIDHNKSNNKIENLREVNYSANMRNLPIYKNNTSGVMGIVWDNDRARWRSQIRVDGKTYNLGRFAKFSDAVDARKNAEVLYAFHHNHGKVL